MTNLKTFIGQDSAKKNIQLLIEAAKLGRTLPHIGLYGPAGCGKTTLAQIIAEEIGAEFVYINGSAVTTPVVFRNVIADAIKAKGRDKFYVVVVDEAHALSKNIQNSLLSVLETPSILCTPSPRRIKLGGGKVIEKGEIIREKLPDNTTFIMATTDKGKLTDAMLSRLHSIYLSEYTLSEKIINIEARLKEHSTDIDKDAAEQLALCARGMRETVKITDRAIDYAYMKALSKLSKSDALQILNILGYDNFGRTQDDVKYMAYLKKHEPSSLSNLARYLNVAEIDVKEKIEPFLVRNEWIVITPRGRKLTELAYSMFWGLQITCSLSVNDVLESLDIRL